MAFEEKRPETFVYYAHDWANVSNRYLGFKFQINGETHYGWARLTVNFHGGPLKVRTWEAHLTGYAYETVAGQAIAAGETSSSSEATPEASRRSSPVDRDQVGALGALALGADGMALWRRED